MAEKEENKQVTVQPVLSFKTNLIKNKSFIVVCAAFAGLKLMKTSFGQFTVTVLTITMTKQMGWLRR